ncbi:MAG: hypothetical protein AAGF94_18270 [Pseudomonadota bacterium]
MLLERTISQLDVGDVPDHIAEKMGHLGYAQWLGALKGEAGYFKEAMRAYELAQPFIRTSPAVAVFCHLLVESTASPLRPLALKLPAPVRRGGSKARRDLT